VTDTDLQPAVIVKVQRPLVWSGQGQPLWLIYAKGGARMRSVPEAHLPRAVRKAMGKDARAFFNARFSHKSGWVLLDRVDDPGW
jgi:hypothetical protein